MLAFGVGIAGLAAAATAFYQLNRTLAEQSTPATYQAADPAADAGPSPDAGANGGQAPPGESTPAPVGSSSQAPASTSSPAPIETPLPPAGSGFGWVRFGTSLDLAVVESNRTIGSTVGDPIRLPVGIHSLVLVSDAYNVRLPVRVAITSDRTTRTSVLLPMGSVSINALPWAEVWIDGQSVGLTPMANVAVPVGRREIVWRHPQLGERRQTVAVRAKVPLQVGVDFSR